MQKSYEILLQKLNRFVRAYYRNLIFRGCIYSSISLFALLFLFAIIEHLSFLSGVVRSIFFWTYCLSTILIVIRFIIIPYIPALAAYTDLYAVNHWAWNIGTGAWFSLALLGGLIALVLFFSHQKNWFKIQQFL